MLEKVKKFLRDEEGASMAEYAVLIGLITAALVVVIGAFSGAISQLFTDVTGVIAVPAA